MAIIKSSTFIFAAAALLLSSSVDGASIRGSTSATNNSSNNKRFLRHADDQQGDRVLFAQRNLQKKNKGKNKGKNKNKSNKGFGATITSLVLPTTPPAPTPAPGPSMEDWVNECVAHANAVQSCKGSDPNNYCGMCLKALASVGTAATNYDGGIKSCSTSSCGGCDTSVLLPFFECGLVVEGKATPDAVFTGNSLPVPTPAVVPVSPPPPTSPPTDNVDRINCPAVFPGSGTTCVMVGSYEYKVCAYPERGEEASCGCSAAQPIWSCIGVSVFDPIVIEGVEEEDLSVVIVEEDKEIIVNEVGEDVIVDVVDVDVVDVVDVDIVDVVDVDIVDEVAPVLPSVFVDVVVNGITVESLCPTEEPKTGEMCSAGGFDSIKCCYEYLISEVEATRTCECDKDGSNPTFTCYTGAESTCTIV